LTTTVRGALIRAMTDDGDHEEAMLSAREVGQYFGGKSEPLAKNTIWRWVREGKLPKPIMVGPKMARWRFSDCKRIRDAMFQQAGAA
jgi:prophage regulatory protein